TELNVDLGNHVRAQKLVVWQIAGHDMAIRVQRRGFRQLRPDLAIVRRRPTAVEAPLNSEVASRPRVGVDVQAVEAGVLRPVVAGTRYIVVRGTEEGRVDVVKPGDRIAASARQTRVDWRRDGERVEVVRRHVEVVRDEEPVEPAPEITDL